jgi:hypothetical protein
MSTKKSEIVWKTQRFSDGAWHITIDGATIKDAYEIIHEWTEKNHECIAYSDLMTELKQRGHPKIYRRSIGHIVGHITNQIAIATQPASVYPSSIVVHKWTRNTGDGFWGLDKGSSPPYKVAPVNRRQKLDEYQNAVFTKNWYLPSILGT